MSAVKFVDSGVWTLQLDMSAVKFVVSKKPWPFAKMIGCSTSKTGATSHFGYAKGEN